MEEKTLIESKKSPIISRTAVVGLALIVLALILRITFPEYWMKARIMDGGRVGLLDYLESLVLPYESWDFVFSGLFYIGVILLIYGVILLIAFRNVSMTVTDKRVFGTASWGKRIDLPLDMISAVATASLGGIAVSTSSGAIRFKGMKNNVEIHETISKLLLRRQETKTASEPVPAKPENKPQVKSDELRELKNLLDDGVITQEEFDAKKKQLLGL
jgi:hypothetical protein